MNSYFSLAGAALLPVMASVVIHFGESRGWFKKFNKIAKQAIIGVIFGGLAIIGTEFGIPMNGAVVNCRDAAVLSAGLFFGSPAGIIAGLIGGIQRWIAAERVGTFTQVACTVSTIVAGFYAAVLRKYLFNGRKPSGLLSLAIGIVMEVFHLTMVFVTNVDQSERALAVAMACSVPMVLANGISVMLTGLTVDLMRRKGQVKVEKHAPYISQLMQTWLLVTVAIAFVATSYFILQLQNSIAYSSAQDSLSVALEDARADIRTAIKNRPEGQEIEYAIAGRLQNRSVGQNGALAVYDGEGNMISSSGDAKINGLDIRKEGIRETAADEIFQFTNRADKSVTVFWCMLEQEEGYTIVSALPQTEVYRLRDMAVLVNTFLEILVFAVMFGLIYLLIRKTVVEPVEKVNASLARITEGNLDEEVNVVLTAEFASLSGGINATVASLKNYIAEASARIDKELELAKSIQSSALPNAAAMFPTRKGFDIASFMRPAKEVGGDFYDFYPRGKDSINFLIADVSGKGIPAAMFMMRAKTELKTLTEADLPLDEVFTRGNDALCEGNDAGMFVTGWQGCIDLATGKMRFVNAGHNPPLICHANGEFEYMKSKCGFVLAGMEGIRYKLQEVDLQPGDIVFLYTDGVTEATNAEKKLFGEDALRTRLSSLGTKDPAALIAGVIEEVDRFVAEAPQFDDITMLCFRFDGKKEDVPMMKFDRASGDDIPTVTDFIDGELEKIDCSMKAQMQIDVAIDEIWSNIAKFAYPGGNGPASISIRKLPERRAVELVFTDAGVPYDPLAKSDPDITLSAEERGIGGLGIYMVKKTMDEVRYEYTDGQNVLTLIKSID